MATTSPYYAPDTEKALRVTPDRVPLDRLKASR